MERVKLTYEKYAYMLKYHLSYPSLASFTSAPIMFDGSYLFLIALHNAFHQTTNERQAQFHYT